MHKHKGRRRVRFLRSALALLLAGAACQPEAPAGLLDLDAIEQKSQAVTAEERAVQRAEKKAARQLRRRTQKALRKALNKVDGGTPGHYIVVLEDAGSGVVANAQRPQLAAARLATRHRFRRKQLFRNVMQGFSVDMDEEAAMALARDPEVAYVVEDVPTEHMATQSSAPWGIDRVDQRALPLDTAYTTNRTGKGVHVYLIDTGTVPTHSELAGKVSLDLDLVEDGRGGIDCDGHGTHVAGTIAGKTFGVAKDARIHSLRVLDCNGAGLVSDVMAALDWVISNHVKPAVVNLSLGGAPLTEFDDMVREVIASGISVVAAAGNQGSFADDFSPSRVLEAIVVGATDVFDGRADFSNFGRAVDIFAPGAAIASAWHSSPVATATLSGTSMATPMVTGTAALFLEGNKNASPAAVEAAILNSSTRGVVKDPGAGPINRLLFTGLTAPSTRPVLFVVGDTNLSAADAALRNRLQGRGYAVTLKKDSALSSGDASGKAFVLISASVNSGDVNTKLTSAATPVMSLEGYLFDDLKMTGNRENRDYGQMNSLTTLHIEDDFNPLAAGLRGTFSEEGWDETVVPSTAGKLYWGVPNANAIGPDGIPITHLGDPNLPKKAAVFAYEKGATMVGRTAPARRLAFFADGDSVRTFTAEGWALFDSAVEWTAGAGPDEAPQAIGLHAAVAPRKVTLEWTAFDLGLRTQIRRSTRRGGPYTLITTTAAQEGPFYAYVDASVSNGQTYYYVVTPVDAAGKPGRTSDEVQVKLAAPPVPRNMQIDLHPLDGGVTLSWTHGLGASETRIARGDSSLGPFSILATVPALPGETVAFFNDQSAAAQRRYHYVLTSANAFGVGPATAPLEVTTEPQRTPASLTGLVATPIPGGLRVKWDHVVGAISYRITARRLADQTDVADSWTSQPDATLWLPPEQDFEVIVAPSGHVLADAGTVSARTGTGSVLLVVGQDPPRAGDAVLAARLTNQGLAATLRRAEDLTATDLADKQLVVVSSTATPAGLSPLLSSAGVPIVTLEAFALAPLRLTNAAAANFGVMGNQATLLVEPPAPHPLAAGQERSSAVTTNLGNIGWGIPLPSAVVIARLPGTTINGVTAAASLFGYERGAALADGAPAPARRVAFLADADALPGLTEDGGGLLDAAIRWAIDPAVEDPAAPQALVATANADDVALSWPPVAGATAYAVFRANAIGAPEAPAGLANGSAIALEAIATGITAPTFIDTTGADGVLYTYAVQALSPAGGSPFGPARSAGIAAPPARPVIATTALDRAVRVAITATGSVASLRVKRALDSGGPYTTVASNLPPGTTSYTATGLSNGTPYYLIVEAINPEGVSRSFESFSVPGLAPAAPAGLVAAASSGKVTLTWNAVAGARSYSVGRGAGNASQPTELVVGDSLASTAIDLNVKNGQPYRYFVTALGDPGIAGPPATVTSTPRGNALVVRSSVASPGDIVVRDRLTALGFSVVERNEVQLTTADAAGKDLVVVSNVVNTAQAGAKLFNVTSAVLSMESLLYGDLRMTGQRSGIDFGVTPGQTQVDVVDATHPLAAGGAGAFATHSTPVKGGWGIPSAQAAIVARQLPASPNGPLPALFAYQAGAAMVGMAAPGRRVGFVGDGDTATSLTPAGRALLDAALLWAAGLGR